MKTDAVFKRAFNDALGVLAKVRPGGHLPSESALATRLKVSRTTVRKVLSSSGDQNASELSIGARLGGETLANAPLAAPASAASGCHARLSQSCTAHT